MQESRLRTPLAMVVLGMLSEEPLHPYAMRRRLQERAHDRLPGVKASSLYDVVKRLAAADLIRADEPVRSGGRPERIPFAVTPAGRAELESWLEQTLADDTDPDSLPAALSLMYSLDPARVRTLLEERVSRMTAALHAAEAELAYAAPANPVFASEHRYQLARRRAERDWLVGFLEDLRSGSLSWPG